MPSSALEARVSLSHLLILTQRHQKTQDVEEIIPAWRQMPYTRARQSQLPELTLEKPTSGAVADADALAGEAHPLNAASDQLEIYR